ncbi:proteasome subunit beta type-5 [Platysternon megacephalum]|uniref:Proteasome subunit beta type-5 n=1 Tax=Platysternon megacephalum TaxID=55544 RepID=A0A4D9DQZ8_9SAUR|nr:proteasome subunit beta type-5 [Platysternon megacephalum]
MCVRPKGQESLSQPLCVSVYVYICACFLYVCEWVAVSVGFQESHPTLSCCVLCVCMSLCVLHYVIVCVYMTLCLCMCVACVLHCATLRHCMLHTDTVCVNYTVL